MNLVKGIFGIQDAPPPPDYRGAAQETATGNLQAAQYATHANRINQNTPYGSLKYSMTPGANGQEDWTQDVNLSPIGQQLLDQQNHTSLQMGGLQNYASDRVGNQLQHGWDDASVPGQGQAFDPYSQDMGYAYNMDAGPSAGQAYDPYSMQMGNVYDPHQDTNTATDAIMSRLNPQIDRQHNQLSTQLANQGIAQGSEAYKNAMTDQSYHDNDLMTQAGLQGINLGMQQQGQQYNQVNGNFGIDQGAQSQNFGQQNQNMMNYAQLQNQQFSQDNQLYGMNQGAQSQQFGQQQQAHQQGLQDQNYYGNRDLNQLSAIRTGAQVTNPTFSAVPQQATTAGADILGATGQQYNAQLGQTNANNAFSGNLMNGLFSMGGSYMMGQQRGKTP